MIIFLLQIRGVLPCLQAISTPDTWSHFKSNKESLKDSYFYNDVKNLHHYWKCQNTESIGELLVAFFKYYSTDFPYVHGAISIRTGTIIQKELKGWTKERQHEINKSGIKDRFWLCIEHPFGILHLLYCLFMSLDVQYNVGKSIDKETLFEIRGEFIRASKLLCNTLHGDYLLRNICQDKIKY